MFMFAMAQVVAIVLLAVQLERRVLGLARAQASSFRPARARR